MLSRWMRENLDNCQDPRRFGKQLLGDRGHLWRYRVDKYRLLAKINDDTIEILIVDVGHRDKVYK
ncbi:MAG: type II toxin-antitoxin system RelE/ParE family toxin [Defluviitaleaceae bacterium]|nr:type II toxin-antitoxin system RelE/ParE family toxin [Defluviitaleaceae bacterium]